MNAWLKTNSGDVASQFGITVQQLEGVIAEYQHAFTSGISLAVWVGAALLLTGAVLAWFTFQRQAAVEPQPSPLVEEQEIALTTD